MDLMRCNLESKDLKILTNSSLLKKFQIITYMTALLMDKMTSTKCLEIVQSMENIGEDLLKKSLLVLMMSMVKLLLLN